MNSRRKGSTFERFVANELKKTFNWTAQDCFRTPLSGGHQSYVSNADITLSATALEIFPVCIECKHYKSHGPGDMFSMRADKEKAWHEQVLKACAQTEKKQSVTLLSMLITKGNGGDPWVFVPRADFYQLFTELHDHLRSYADQSIRYRFGKTHQEWVGYSFREFLEGVRVVLLHQ